MRAHLLISFFFCVSISSGHAQPAALGGGAGVDSKGVRHIWGANSTKPAPYPVVITKRVWPDFPVEARRWGLEGAGLFRVQIDLGTGKVVKATVLRSTGHVVLDNSILSALRGWQFKPGTWKEMDIPFSFSRSLPRGAVIQRD